MPDRINVGIIGFGVVGGGTYETLTRNAERIAARVGAEVRVARVADVDWAREREITCPPELRTTDAAAMVVDPEIHIVVETIGGIDPARELISQAIQAGKSVVTSNKELIAKHGHELLALAEEKGVDVQFEGSVGGVIPVIRSLKESLEADRITEVMGIVNGTTNYILTRMTTEGLDFAQALTAAQELGYAEADPTNDVEGIDAKYKIAILAAIAFGLHVPLEEIYTEGITRVTAQDIAYAKKMGYAIKLLAIARQGEGNCIEARVHPVMLRKTHPLANVNGPFNAIFVRGDGCDEVMLYGRGAGARPTGVAVAGDVLDCARNLHKGLPGRVLCTCHDQARVLPMADITTKSYVRMRVKDRPGVLGSIATIFGTEGVSIASVHQEDTDGELAEIVWVTHRTPEASLRSALGAIGNLAIVDGIPGMLRVED
ncbi:MAG: homoserine dehydrogenase [Armatimonadetes bacterium]|nr:homoserine dehydrogenase [Armatimonadota bacterium]